MRKYEVNINDKSYSVCVKKYTSQHAELEINGEPYSVTISGMITGVVGNTSEFAAQLNATSPEAIPVQPITAPSIAPQPVSAAQPQKTSGDGVVSAPIPGSILVIKVKEGEEVKTGQLLLKMEAMKMENEINASCSGTVTAIKVSVGDSVGQGDVLVEIG